MIIIHPTVQGLSKNVSHDTAESWLAQGWLPAGSPEALAAAPEVPVCEIIGATPVKDVRPPVVVDDAPLSPPCPTCGASGEETCVTASGNETNRHAKRA
jgi:hypothetical protein